MIVSMTSVCQNLKGSPLKTDFWPVNTGICFNQLGTELRTHSVLFPECEFPNPLSLKLLNSLTPSPKVNYSVNSDFILCFVQATRLRCVPLPQLGSFCRSLWNSLSEKFRYKSVGREICWILGKNFSYGFWNSV